VDGNGKAILPAYLVRVILGLFPQLTIEKVTRQNMETLASIATAEDGLDDLADTLRAYLNQENATVEEEQRKTLKILCNAYKEHEIAGRIQEAALTTYENVPLSEMAAELLYRDRNKGSVSRLEQFAGCAYAQFLRYGLELKEQEEYDFNAMDFGIIYHHVLEMIFKELSKQRLTLIDADEELLRGIIGDILDAYTKEYGAWILHSNARNEYRICQMKEVLQRSVMEMKYQLSKGKFQPAYFERAFRLKGEFPLVGKIDRIDLCREDD
jgi:ATP-dependent helicase/nuclease subunit B